MTNVYGNGTNSTVGANTVVHFYDRAGIKAANRVNVYGQFASKKYQPQKMGKTYKISKFLHTYDRTINDAEFSSKGYLTNRSIDDLNTIIANASLPEGAGETNLRELKKITVEATLARYGEMMKYTDDVELFSEDTMQVRYRTELGEMANSLMEDLQQYDMLATPTVLYAGSATAVDEVDADSTVSYDLIRKAVRTLVRNRAPKNTSLVTGDVKVDTRTIDRAYYAIIGANVKGDLETLTRGSVADNGTTEFVYIPVHKYGAATKIAEGEVGAMHEVRFIESESAIVYAGKGADLPTTRTDRLSATGGKYDVFPILFPSQDCFACVNLKGKDKIKFNMQAPEKVSDTNPYGTKGFFSYNFRYAGLILEEEKLLKVLVTASA